MKKHNFSAGPSILFEDVLKKASQAIIELDDTGLSLVEMSHRDKRFIAIMDQAQELALQLLGLEGKGYKALFLQGGASTQFIMACYNLLEHKAGYLDTGSWSSKAIKEAKSMGDVEVLASSKDKNYNYIPKGYDIPTDLDYLHLTTNNTIFGTQFKQTPETNVPLISDMSSDIFSCQRDFSKYSLIYAGAQKNIGPSGVTLVVVKEDILGKISRQIPTILDYTTHIKAGSMFNTPPVFPVYMCMLSLEKLKNMGGIAAIEKINEQKASLLYQEIDKNPLLVPFANKEDRSNMNVTFNLSDDNLKTRFDELALKANLSGINGHRSVGGYRASIYNAMPIESVQALVDVMQEFEKTV